MRTILLRAWVLGGMLALAQIVMPSVSAQTPPPSVAGTNAIESIETGQQAGQVLVKITLRHPLAQPPGSFTVANPARLVFDFQGASNALGKSAQALNEGHLRSVNVVEVGDRTRVVFNLNRLSSYETRLDGRTVMVSLSQPTSEVATAQTTHFAVPQAKDAPHDIKRLNFRRGKDGEGRIVVDLSDADTGIDIRQQGSRLVVDFLKTSLPKDMQRRYDVQDFATPVSGYEASQAGQNARIVVTPKGLWEHNAYQSDNQFIVEVRQVKEDPNKLVQGSKPGYQGEKLSLNFQNIDVRAVLQVIADFTNNNIITSDSVGGALTLRLKDVPWDQALDIILDAKGLDKRKNGNVIWIAPRDELAAKEKLELEARQQIGELEPTRTESFQLNYQRAEAVATLLKDKAATLLSKRGTAIFDAKSNKLFVTDTTDRLDNVRRFIGEIDIASRQVLIEARIVEANDDFAKNLGARLGFFDFNAPRFGGTGNPLLDVARINLGSRLEGTAYNSGVLADPVPKYQTEGLAVNLPASAIAGKQTGAFSFSLFNSAATRFLQLEVSALEQDGKGKVISSPRVMTADQREALIEQGVEIPYQQATSSGATSISFRKANLSLKVTPQITPDGRVQMALDINKDSPNTQIATGAGVAIDTKHVKTDVLVENGGTVVIGGIYTQNEQRTQARVPFLGDLPYVGFLFRNTESRDNRSELLIFVTPRIANDTLSLR